MTDPAERAAIAAEWKRLSAEPIPPNQKPVGCVVAILAVVVIAAAPAALKLIGWKFLDAIVLGGALVALLWGLVVGFLTGDKGAQHVYRRLEAAQKWFEAHRDGGDPIERMQAAVALVHYPHFSNGPSMSMLLDVAQARRRLGAAAAYVEEVERVLVEEVQAWPVFTASQTAA